MASAAKTISLRWPGRSFGSRSSYWMPLAAHLRRSGVPITVRFTLTDAPDSSAVGSPLPSHVIVWTSSDGGVTWSLSSTTPVSGAQPLPRRTDHGIDSIQAIPDRHRRSRLAGRRLRSSSVSAATSCQLAGPGPGCSASGLRRSPQFAFVSVLSNQPAASRLPRQRERRSHPIETFGERRGRGCPRRIARRRA
jgi:hypothetical protein